MDITYDPEVDAIYASFVDEPAVYGSIVDEERVLDYSASGSVIGVEFLNVGQGIRLIGLPIDTTELARELRSAEFQVLDDVQVTGDLDFRRSVSFVSSIVIGLPALPTSFSVPSPLPTSPGTILPSSGVEPVNYSIPG